MSRKAASRQKTDERKRPGRGFIPLRFRAWIAFAFLFPLMAGEGDFFRLTPGYLPLFIATLMAWLLGLWGLFEQRRTLALLAEGSGWIFPALFTLWCSLSLTWTISYDYSVYLLTPVLLGFLLFLSMGGVKIHRESLLGIVKGLVASTVLLSLFALYQVIAKFTESGPTDPLATIRPPSVYKDANTYGSIVSILFPLNLFLMLTIKEKGQRIFFIAALVLNLAGLFLVASRGPAILMIACVALSLAFEARQKIGPVKTSMRRLVMLAGGFVLLLVLFQVVCQVIGQPSVLNRLIDFHEMVNNALARRVAYWQAAWGVFIEQPGWGSGLNTLQQNIFPHLAIGTYTRFPHNIVVQFLAEIGLPGALFFLGTVIFALSSGVARARREPLAFYVMLALLVLVSYAFFDITFQCASVVFLFFVLLALLRLLGNTAAPVPEPPETRSKVPVIMGGVLAVGIAAASCFAVYESFRVFRAYQDKYAAEKLTTTAQPFRVDQAYRDSLASRHLLNHLSYSAWLLQRYARTGKEETFARGMEQKILAYERGGENPCEAYGIGKAYLDAGKLEQAESWLVKAVEGFPSSMRIWRAYLLCLEKTERYHEAIQHLTMLSKGEGLWPELARYNAIEQFHLEVMLARLSERCGQIVNALALYQNLEKRYGGLEFLEAFYPMESQVRRMPLAPELDQIRAKIGELTAAHRKWKRKQRFRNR